MLAKTHNPLLAFATAMLAIFSLVGCEREDATPAPNGATAPAGNGIIRGEVKIIGWNKTLRPTHTKIQGQDLEIPDESVVVNPNGTLRNVVVFLENAPPHGGDRSKPVILDQQGLRYRPHVVALQVGQILRVKNDDPTLHNVHLGAKSNPAQNLSMPGPGTQDVTFDRPEVIRTGCDVHPWMRAYVAVFDHPYFAVTGEDGGFRITGVPPGTYTLMAWHELLPRLERTITVADDKPADVEFTFRPPSQ